MTELGKHAPHFAILAFGEHHFQDGGLSFLADHSNITGSDLPLGQPDPFHQLVEHLARRGARDDDPVELLDAEARMGELVG